MNEQEKVQEVFSDEEFVKSLLQLQTPEEVQAALEEKDIDMSIADIKQLGAILQKKANGELSDEDLENVSGGYVGFVIAGVVAFVGIVGAFVGGGIAASGGRSW